MVYCKEFIRAARHVTGSTMRYFDDNISLFQLAGKVVSASLTTGCVVMALLPNTDLSLRVTYGVSALAFFGFVRGLANGPD